MLASVASDHTLRLWSLADGRELARLDLPMPLERIAFVDDRLVGGDTLGNIMVFEIDASVTALLRELSERRYRPPGAKITRTFSVPTLERWLRRYRKGGLEALRPEPRATGHAKALTDEQRELILEIRRERPGASVPLILRAYSGALGHLVRWDLGTRSGVLGRDRSEATTCWLSRSVCGLGSLHALRLADRRPGQRQHMSVVHQAVADRVGNRRIGEHFMPVFGRDLAGDHRRFAVIAILEHFE
jgi:hypothetical protein